MIDVKELRTLADTIDDHAHEVGGIGPASMHSIAAIIRKSIETNGRGDPDVPPTSVEDPIGTEAVYQRILATREPDTATLRMPRSTRNSQHPRVTKLRVIHETLWVLTILIALSSPLT
jgi:hypothetical protein